MQAARLATTSHSAPVCSFGLLLIGLCAVACGSTCMLPIPPQQQHCSAKSQHASCPSILLLMQPFMFTST